MLILHRCRWSCGVFVLSMLSLTLINLEMLSQSWIPGINLRPQSLSQEGFKYILYLPSAGEKNLLRWEVSCCIRPNINLYSKARKNLETSASWRHKWFGGQDGIRPVEKKLMLGENSSREKSNIIRSCVDWNFAIKSTVERCQSQNAVGGRGCHSYFLWAPIMIYRSLCAPQRCEHSYVPLVCQRRWIGSKIESCPHYVCP